MMESLLKLSNLRPLPIALGQCIARLRPDDPAQGTLQALYRGMIDADQMLVRAEIHACRSGMRGEQMAKVA